MTKDSNNHSQGLFLSRFLRYSFELPHDKQIQLNQIGIPEYPKVIYIEGEWVHGDSLPKK